MAPSTSIRKQHGPMTVGVLLVLLALAPLSARAQRPESPDDLAPLFDVLRAGTDLPALAGAVWRGDRLVAIGATGVRKAGDTTKVSVSDQWHLGSDTKAMTATLIGRFIDRGTLHFEDTLGKLFAGETLDHVYAAVTLEQLLQHRGGAPHEFPPDIWQHMWATPTRGERTAAVRELLSRPPATKPGTFSYSNAGYMIAGVALERVTGKPWEQLIQEELFTPLGMSSAGFGAPGSPDKVNEPWGHVVPLPDGKSKPVTPGLSGDNPPSLGPAGTVHCSLADWGKFLAVELKGARHEKTVLLSPQTFDRLLTPPRDGDYACGWLVLQRSWGGGDGTVLTHTGSNTMWLATAWLAPAKNVTFAVVTNRGDALAHKLTDQAFGPLIRQYAP